MLRSSSKIYNLVFITQTQVNTGVNERKWRNEFEIQQRRE